MTMLRRRFMELIGGAPALGLSLNTRAMEQEPSHPATTAAYEANWSPLIVADAADSMVVSTMGDMIPKFMPDHWTWYGWRKRFFVDSPQQLPHPLSQLAIGAEQIHWPTVAKDNQALITFEREGSRTARLLDSLLKETGIPILRVVAASTNPARPLATSRELCFRHSMGIHWLEFQNPWEVALSEQFSKAVERAGSGLGECTLAEMEAEGLPLGELFSRAVNFSAEVLALSYSRMATTRLTHHSSF
jgi:hypothetical protein